MAGFKELRRLLVASGIDSIQAAMRSKVLAKLGDPLVNLLHSLAQSLVTKRFEGGKVSGRILATALRLAKLRHLAPSRLDAHGLGDSVEAMMAYTWIRGTLNIPEAAKLLAHEIQQTTTEKSATKQPRIHPAAAAFAVLLHHLWVKEQEANTIESQ